MSKRIPAEAYLGFSWAYDEALGLAFHRGLEPVLDRLFGSLGLTGGRHLDLACGTAIPTDFFRKRGFKGIGVDASISMLEIASRRTSALVCGDIRAIPLKARFDLVTAFYDSLNHLMDRESLHCVFESVARMLRQPGWFLFDVNHPDAFEDIWGCREPYRSSGEGYDLAMWTRYSPRRRIGRADIRGWVSRGGEKTRLNETRRQRAWDETEVRESLDRAGLEVEDVVPFDPFPDPYEPRNVKLLFVVRLP